MELFLCRRKCALNIESAVLSCSYICKSSARVMSRVEWEERKQVAARMTQKAEASWSSTTCTYSGQSALCESQKATESALEQLKTMTESKVKTEKKGFFTYFTSSPKPAVSSTPAPAILSASQAPSSFVVTPVVGPEAITGIPLSFFPPALSRQRRKKSNGNKDPSPIHKRTSTFLTLPFARDLCRVDEVEEWNSHKIHPRSCVRASCGSSSWRALFGSDAQRLSAKAKKRKVQVRRRWQIDPLYSRSERV